MFKRNLFTKVMLLLCFLHLIFYFSDKYDVRRLHFGVYDINGLSSIKKQSDYPFSDLPMLATVYGDISNSTDWNLTYSIMDPSSYDIGWSNIVFIINIYDSLETNELLGAHFDTWLRHVGEGLDIVFITDSDDVRSINEILPYTNKTNATCHVYKSSAKNEKKRLRYKIIDGFRHVGEEKFDSSKKYFFKMDTDTFVVPHYLLAYVNDLHEKTYPKPVQVGFGNHCRRFLCYADGSFYGFNDIGFAAVNQYFVEHPSPEKIRLYPSFNLLSDDKVYEFRLLAQHEDFMVSYVYREATKIPMIHNHLITTHDHGITNKNGLSFHRVRDPSHFHEYENRFYFRNGTLKRGLMD